MTVQVLHLLHRFGFGGTERVIANLLNHSGKGVTNFIGGFFPHDEDFLDELTLKSNTFWLDKKPGNDPFMPFKIASLCRKHKIDIVHSLGWGTYAEGFLAAKGLLRIPFIFSYRGKTMEDTIGLPKRRVLAQRLFSRFTDLILSPSKISRKEYAEEIGINPEIISVIYNGVDVNRFAPDLKTRTEKRSELKIKPDEIVIGSVGRLDPVKNIDSLVKGFAGLTDRLRGKCKLFIVGDGSDREKIESMIGKYGLKGSVILAGMRRDIPDLLKLMDIYVQPSKYEGIPNSVLEAMASSLPVIATNVGGVSEIVNHDDNGFLYPVGNQDELLNYLTALIKDPARRLHMGIRGRERAISLFSMQKMVETYETVYKKLLNRFD